MPGQRPPFESTVVVDPEDLCLNPYCATIRERPVITGERQLQ